MPVALIEAAHVVGPHALIRMPCSVAIRRMYAWNQSHWEETSKEQGLIECVHCSRSLTN